MVGYGCCCCCLLEQLSALASLVLHSHPSAGVICNVLLLSMQAGYNYRTGALPNIVSTKHSPTAHRQCGDGLF